MIRNGREQLPLFKAGSKEAARSKGRRLAVTGIFSGIGGIELGLHQAGHHTLLMCEIDEGAAAVLRSRFPATALHDDVRTLRQLPQNTDLLAGGFPCQDLSQAGRTAGINGSQSSLVDEAFRLIRSHDVPWLVLENVPFMLQLNRGEALEHLVSALEETGYRWAYRVVDSRSMGVPQRRERVYLVASKEGDPRDVLLADDAGAPKQPVPDSWRQRACGFYWTEGLRGLGWAYDAVPTLKAGSTVGIPSPPAIVLTSGEIVKPDIRDAERMQGFDVDWTKPSEEVNRRGHRWRLVGNAVTVDTAAWLGERLLNPGLYDSTEDELFCRKSTWPRAAWGLGDGERYVSRVSTWPLHIESPSLEDFLRYPAQRLSAKATAGFYSRAQRAKLRFPDGFLDVVEDHLESVRAES